MRPDLVVIILQAADYQDMVIAADIPPTMV